MIEITSLASGSKGNCYVLRSAGRILLIEAGIPISAIRRGTKYQLTKVDACLVTHEHGDHSKAAKDLLKLGVPVYMSAGTKGELNLNSYHPVIPITNKMQPVGSSWHIFPFRVEHDAAEPLGFMVRGPEDDDLLYVTDTYYLGLRFTSPIHYMMIECNYSLDIIKRNVERGVIPQAHKNRVMKSHMELSTIQGIIDANDLSQCREIWLLHLSDANSDAERFRDQVEAWAGIPVKVA